MVEFLNKLLNSDPHEMSADEKAQAFADFLNKIFDYIAKLLDI